MIIAPVSDAVAFAAFNIDMGIALDNDALVGKMLLKVHTPKAVKVDTAMSRADLVAAQRVERAARVEQMAALVNPEVLGELEEMDAGVCDLLDAPMFILANTSEEG